MSSATGNSKLKKDPEAKYAYTFSLPAGYTCPFALKCKAQVDDHGKIVRGPDMEFQCFGATSEVRSSSLRKAVNHNFRLLREAGIHNVEAMSNLIIKSIPPDARRIRVHTTGGDFFNADYLRAWLRAARLYDDVLFYCYTKSLRHWVVARDTGLIPENFRIVASFGGTQDHLIEEHNLVYAKVVYHPDEAKALGLEIDHDDSLCMKADKSFALLIHGQQAAGSAASKAIQQLKKENIEYSYGRD